MDIKPDPKSVRASTEAFVEVLEPAAMRVLAEFDRILKERLAAFSDLTSRLAALLPQKDANPK